MLVPFSRSFKFTDIIPYFVYTKWLKSLLLAAEEFTARKKKSAPSTSTRENVNVDEDEDLGDIEEEDVSDEAAEDNDEDEDEDEEDDDEEEDDEDALRRIVSQDSNHIESKIVSSKKPNKESKNRNSQ